MSVVKRDGRKVRFNKDRIVRAIRRAGDVPIKWCEELAENIKRMVYDSKKNIAVEEIQNLVSDRLWIDYPNVARDYEDYREKRSAMRDADAEALKFLEDKDDYIKYENSNKNASLVTQQRDYLAGILNKRIGERLLPDYVVEQHRRGIIHVHDTDYLAQQLYSGMHNCELVNLDDMLQNGTVLNGVHIHKPHSLMVAMNLATQIALGVCSSTYGGQTHNLWHMAKFVDVSRKRIEADVEEEYSQLTGSEKKRIVQRRLDYEVQQAVQVYQYQLVSMYSTNGQTPFITLSINLRDASEGQDRDDLAYLAREVFRQRIKGLPNAQGEYVTPAFPKIIYVLSDLNDHESAPYWSLTMLAAKCTAQRMVPDYVSEYKIRDLKGENTDEHGDVAPMGCRNFLPNNGHGYWGRFNMGVTTINLPYLALWARERCDDEIKRVKDFFNRLDRVAEFSVRKVGKMRAAAMAQTTSDHSPLMYQYGAIARLQPGETLERLVYGGYATVTMGYVGLYECVKALIGENHWEEGRGKNLAIAILKRLNAYCDNWTKEDNIKWGLYGTPEESTTYKFAKALKRFDTVETVNDKDYVMNSYHIPVWLGKDEGVNAFDKISWEAPFQDLTTGGAITYVELPDLTTNVNVVLEIIKHISKTCLYAEMNTKSDYCHVCGNHNCIDVVDDGHEFGYKCRECGNTDYGKMNVARRVCGYISTTMPNQGRLADIEARKEHV